MTLRQMILLGLISTLAPAGEGGSDGGGSDASGNDDDANDFDLDADDDADDDDADDDADDDEDFDLDGDDDPEDLRAELERLRAQLREARADRKKRERRKKQQDDDDDNETELERARREAAELREQIAQQQAERVRDTARAELADIMRRVMVSAPHETIVAGVLASVEYDDETGRVDRASVRRVLREMRKATPDLFKRGKATSSSSSGSKKSKRAPDDNSGGQDEAKAGAELGAELLEELRSSRRRGA